MPAGTAELTGCLEDRIGDLLVDETVQMLARRGRQAFGRNFRLNSELSWSPHGRGLAGDADMVLPLSTPGMAGSDGENRAQGHAFFAQQGITRWTDRHGLRRNDIRTGLGYRLKVPSFVGEVLGGSVMIQQNIERGHQRVVLGTDYAGTWGRTSIQRFVPTTDWRRVHAGPFSYEERAIGGTDLTLAFDVTSTISVDAVVGRWEGEDGEGTLVDRHLGLSWQPHP